MDYGNLKFDRDVSKVQQKIISSKSEAQVLLNNSISWSSLTNSIVWSTLVFFYYISIICVFYRKNDNSCWKFTHTDRGIEIWTPVSVNNNSTL